jgi:hypothetical protein
MPDRDWEWIVELVSQKVDRARAAHERTLSLLQRSLKHIALSEELLKVPPTNEPSSPQRSGLSSGKLGPLGESDCWPLGQEAARKLAHWSGSASRGIKAKASSNRVAMRSPSPLGLGKTCVIGVLSAASSMRVVANRSLSAPSNIGRVQDRACGQIFHQRAGCQNCLSCLPNCLLRFKNRLISGLQQCVGRGGGTRSRLSRQNGRGRIGHMMDQSDN